MQRSLSSDYQPFSPRRAEVSDSRDLVRIEVPDRQVISPSATATATATTAVL